MLGRAIAPEGKHGRHSPSRAAAAIPWRQLGSIITLMRIWSQTFTSTDGSLMSPLALVEDATIDGLALMEWANAARQSAAFVSSRDSPPPCAAQLPPLLKFIGG